jgi:hypothetical protein
LLPTFPSPRLHTASPDDSRGSEDQLRSGTLVAPISEVLVSTRAKDLIRSPRSNASLRQVLAGLPDVSPVLDQLLRERALQRLPPLADLREAVGADITT